MKAPDLRYYRPTSITDALAVLADNPGGTKVLAGGQSLLPVLNMRLAEPEVLLDISKLADLKDVTTTANGDTSYGACTIHADFEDGRVPDIAGGLLATAAHGIGYRAIRNRGTLGGSLAHADPSAEWPVVMAALDAHALIMSATGRREVACSALPAGYFTTSLEEDEIITRITISPLPTTASWGFYKFDRKAGEFAESVAAAVVIRSGATTTARVWLGGAASTPIRLARVEQAIASNAPCAEADVIELVGHDLTDAQAASAGDAYRSHLHGVTAWRATAAALAGDLVAPGSSSGR